MDKPQPIAIYGSDREDSCYMPYYEPYDTGGKKNKRIDMELEVGSNKRVCTPSLFVRVRDWKSNESDREELTCPDPYIEQEVTALEAVNPGMVVGAIVLRGEESKSEELNVPEPYIKKAESTCEVVTPGIKLGGHDWNSKETESEVLTCPDPYIDLPGMSLEAVTPRKKMGAHDWESQSSESCTTLEIVTPRKKGNATLAIPWNTPTLSEDSLSESVPKVVTCCKEFLCVQENQSFAEHNDSWQLKNESMGSGM